MKRLLFALGVAATMWMTPNSATAQSADSTYHYQGPIEPASWRQLQFSRYLHSARGTDYDTRRRQRERFDRRQLDRAEAFYRWREYREYYQRYLREAPPAR